MYTKYLKLSVSVMAIAVGANSAAYAQSAESAEQVVVTGSRVITNGNDSPTPLTVISTADITATAPATVFDGLQALPVFDGGLAPNPTPATVRRTMPRISSICAILASPVPWSCMTDGASRPPRLRGRSTPISFRKCCCSGWTW